MQNLNKSSTLKGSSSFKIPPDSVHLPLKKRENIKEEYQIELFSSSVGGRLSCFFFHFLGEDNGKFFVSSFDRLEKYDTSDEI